MKQLRRRLQKHVGVEGARDRRPGCRSSSAAEDAARLTRTGRFHSLNAGRAKRSAPAAGYTATSLKPGFQVISLASVRSADVQRTCRSISPVSGKPEARCHAIAASSGRSKTRKKKKPRPGIEIHAPTGLPPRAVLVGAVPRLHCDGKAAAHFIEILQPSQSE